tara:strand:- start:1698 stop:2213 length:516 start_codon:yes stop_codon:yes gene_type:complete
MVIRYGLIFRLVRLEGAAAYGSGHLAVHGGEDSPAKGPVAIRKDGGGGICSPQTVGNWDEVEPEGHDPPEEGLGDLAVLADDHTVASGLHVLVTNGAGELLPEEDIAEGIDLSLSGSGLIPLRLSAVVETLDVGLLKSRAEGGGGRWAGGNGMGHGRQDTGMSYLCNYNRT